MNKKSRFLLIITIVALAMAIASGPGVGQTTVQASHIDIFDMNARHASKAFDYGGAGVMVVTGNNIDFRIVAEGLAPLEIFTLSVMISMEGPPIDGFARFDYEVVTDRDGELSFEKNNFNLELLAPGDYRVDWMITHADMTDAGRTDTGAALQAMTGMDPILTCQPAQHITISE